jgi:hypothetical protein
MDFVNLIDNLIEVRLCIPTLHTLLLIHERVVFIFKFVQDGHANEQL